MVAFVGDPARALGREAQAPQFVAINLPVRHHGAEIVGERLRAHLGAVRAVSEIRAHLEGGALAGLRPGPKARPPYRLGATAQKAESADDVSEGGLRPVCV